MIQTSPRFKGTRTEEEATSREGSGSTKGSKNTNHAELKYCKEQWQG